MPDYQQSIVRVDDADGQTLGTAFIIGPGLALTCNHVVQSINEIQLVPDSAPPVTATVAAGDRFVEIDLALLTFAVSSLIGPVLPCNAVNGIADNFTSAGYHMPEGGIIGQFPVSGTTGGTVRIRFEFEDQTYELDDAIILRDDPFDGGLSGAPVLDPDSGVAFGVVNSTFHANSRAQGFALRLAAARGYSTRMQEVLDDNLQQMTQYGQFLNFNGVAALAAAQRQATLQELQTLHKYDPQLYCQRSIEEVLAQRAQTDTLVTPIVGPSGVGKTMLLAHVAEQSEAPAVFLAGSNVAGESSGIADVIDRESEILPHGNTADDLCRVLAAHAQHLTVFLDGLNEINMQPAQLNKWVESTTVWLHTNSARLIVTCRPEFWETVKSVIPEKYCAEVVPLELLTKDELSGVRDKYGLPQTIADNEIALPFMARVYAELMSSGETEPGVATRMAAMDRYIEKRCQAVAVSSGTIGGHSLVRSTIESLAVVMLENSVTSLQGNQLPANLQSDMPLYSRLLTEDLLQTTTPGEVRFTFDNVRELLQANWLIHSRVTPAATTPVAVLSLAIEQLAQSGDIERSQQYFRALADSRQCLAVLADLLRYLTDITPYYEMLFDIFRKDSFLLPHLGERSPLPALATSNLSTNQKLALLKELLQHEDRYEYETHHADALRRFADDTPAGVPNSFRLVVAAHPCEAIDELCEWLADESQPSEKSPQIHQAARALLFLTRHVDLEYVVTKLMRDPTQQSFGLLGLLAEDAPQDVMDVLAALEMSAEKLQIYRALHLLLRIATSTLR